jgi:hypothetical protein
MAQELGGKGIPDNTVKIHTGVSVSVVEIMEPREPMRPV